jgi:ribose transport system substrate-binding protein
MMITHGIGLLTATMITGCLLSSEPPDSDDEPDTASTLHIRLAWLANDPANTYDQAMLQGARDRAGSTGTVTPFYAGYDPALQLSQCLDVVDNDDYDAVLMVTDDAVGILPCLDEADYEHVPVVALDLPIGPDPTTVEPQVDGQSGAVLIPASVWGSELTSLVVSKCASKPTCNVAYLAGGFGIAFDAIALADLDAAAATHANIHIVAREEAFYDRTLATTLTQQILVAHPTIHVMVGAGDQMAAGAEDAFIAAGIPTGTIAIVGAGAGLYAVNAVKAGRWFATFMALPYDEGNLGANIAIRDVKHQWVSDRGIDPVLRRGFPRFFRKDYQSSFPGFIPQWPG